MLVKLFALFNMKYIGYRQTDKLYIEIIMNKLDDPINTVFNEN